MNKTFDLHRFGMVLRWDIAYQLEKLFLQYGRIGYRHHHAFHFHALFFPS